jgi:hypothetical protein
MSEVPIPLSCDEERPIPSSWREHFGEEAFADIWVYVQYGDRTPEEALRILGLQPPPGKQMEPKQEGLKPSEEKIEVKTPEISIKEDTKKEEKKMDEIQILYDKSPAPPQLDKLDSGKKEGEGTEGSGIIYNNTPDPREPFVEEDQQGGKGEAEATDGSEIFYKADAPSRVWIFPFQSKNSPGISYDATPRETVEVSKQDIPTLVFNQIEKAFGVEEYSEIADHFLKEAERSDLLNPDLLPEIRRLAGLGKEIKTKEEAATLLAEVKNFLKRWK